MDLKLLFLQKYTTYACNYILFLIYSVQVNKLISLHTIGFYLPKKKYGMGNRGRTLVVKIKREGSAGPTSSVDIVEASQYVKFEFGQPTYCKLKLPKYAQLLPDVSYELSFKFNVSYLLLQ